MNLLRYMRMSCAGPLVVLVLVISSTVIAGPMPTSPTTSRSPPRIGESLKQLTNQLVEVNASSPNIMTFDTRTPPRVKQQTKAKFEQMETSHAGVAIPMDGDDIEEAEETTKKLSFYKIERPTTNSGLSTWILLSGQTTKAPKKPPVVKPNEAQNATVIVDMHKIIKPIFKKRPITTTTQKTTTTQSPKSTTKMTKIKASVLNSALGKKSTPSMSTTKKSTTPKTTTTVKITQSTTISPNITVDDEIKVKNSTNLPVEAKDGETDLSETNEDDKKNKRTSNTNKRKKNKNRRRRPTTTDKSDENNTKMEKVVNNKNKEKPIGTQLYNYISREVMPTVGVGLVGLMVTAGLAGYFLYPFGVARRSYEVDRRDKEGSYYYSDENSGGIAEEEAIGKVIAGMPSNTLFGNTYKTPTSRNGFSTGNHNNNKGGIRNRQVDNLQLTTNYDYQPITYNDNNNHEKDLSYNSGELDSLAQPQQFVVGSVSEEEVTPAAVPEHGPRSLKIRRRRREATIPPEENLNEINSEFLPTTNFEEISTSTTDLPINISTTTEKSQTDNKWNSFLYMMKDLLHLKVNLGLELIKNATQAMSKYVSHVQRRFDQHYKNFTVNQRN